MTDFDRLAEEIERRERWLADAGLEPLAAPDLDAVKRRVRVAIDEAWLAEQGLEPAADRQALAKVKARLGDELRAHGREADATPAASVPPGGVYQFVSTFAVAAALLLAAGLGFWSAMSPGPAPPASFTGLDELAAVMQRDLDEEETEWEALEEELAALEDALAGGPQAAWDETLLDSLDEEIDDLMLEVDLSPEVT